MKLYHGSSKIIKKPQYRIGNPHNDYGLGFYCTEDAELAKEWACPEARDGFSNIYDFNIEDYKVLDLHSEEFHVLNWIALLLKNRIFAKKTPIARSAEEYILQEFLTNAEGYDVICGYRADDSYFAYAKDFLNNAISVQRLEQAMRLENLGSQITLVSERAIDGIEFCGYEVADARVYYAKRMQRESMARKQYLEGHGDNFQTIGKELYIIDILRNEVKNDDKRLFRTICE